MDADDSSQYLDRTTTYRYDPRDRIAQLTKTDTSSGAQVHTETYTHDANNNVTAQTIDDLTTTFSYHRNRLLSATTAGVTAAYNYDPYGRLDTITDTNDRILQRYRYDGFDRITEHRKLTSTGTTDTTRYAYDPLDRTTNRTDHAGTATAKTTDFGYLGLSDQLITEQIGAQVARSYQYSPWGQRLSQVKHNPDSTTEDSFYGYTPHTDVETLTTQAGTTRATYGYTAYGEDDTDAFTGVDKPDPANPDTEPYNVFRYTGKRLDKASGTYDMGFRDYNPGLNRFLARDTYNGALADLTLAASPWTSNRYTLAAGNPITGIELDGHITDSNGGGDLPTWCTNVYQCAEVKELERPSHVWAFGEMMTNEEYARLLTGAYNNVCEMPAWGDVCRPEANGYRPTQERFEDFERNVQAIMYELVRNPDWGRITYSIGGSLTIFGLGAKGTFFYSPRRSWMPDDVAIRGREFAVSASRPSIHSLLSADLKAKVTFAGPPQEGSTMTGPADALLTPGLSIEECRIACIGTTLSRDGFGPLEVGIGLETPGSPISPSTTILEYSHVDWY
jgi:RHS repeat-associated protein